MTHFIGAVVVPERIATDLNAAPTKYPDLYGKNARDISPGTDLNAHLDEILSKFDENKEVEIWVPREQVVAEVRERIKNYQNTTYAKYLADPDQYAADCSNPAHLRYLRTTFPEMLGWTDHQCYADGVDGHTVRESDGARLDTYNPNSKWDWWTIGGRWEETYRNRQGESTLSLLANVQSARVMLEAGESLNPHKEGFMAHQGDLPWYYPHDLLTPDGEWLEIGRTGWFGMRSEDMSEVEWLARMEKALQEIGPGFCVVYIDFHI